MTRRSLLRFLAAAPAAIAAAVVADPEKLLWVPGKKLISIPAPRVVQRAVPIRTPFFDEDGRVAQPWIDFSQSRQVWPPEAHLLDYMRRAAELHERQILIDYVNLLKEPQRGC
jgi:hypothetical protein